MTSGPLITDKQMAGGTGGIASSVNLFRGTVTFPLQLLKLAGRRGLAVSLTAMYDGNVEREVSAVNDVAPTGLLGLGWSLAFDQVTRQDGAFSLTAGGQGGALVALGAMRDPSGGTIYEFALAQYQFWRIRYAPADERWEVVQPDGVAYIYGIAGDARHGVQWGLRWGAWRGSSSASGAARTPIAWNLVEIRNRWGDRVAYHYHEDVVAPGYTQASYLARIVDSHGRTIRLGYGEKLCTADAYEYRPPYVALDGTAPPAYHARFESKYLADISVSAPDGAPDFAVHLGYDVTAAASGATGTAAGARVKRYLTEVSRIEAAGASGPVASFRYELRPSTTSTPRPSGALVEVVHPGGGVASYAYARQTLASAQTAHTVELDGAPGVWFGPDFVVVTALGDGQLGVSAYAWGGTWQPWTDASSISASIATGTLAVATGADWFAVTFTDTAAQPSDHVYVYQRDPGQAGSWAVTAFAEPRSAGGGPTILGAGTAFCALANAAFTDAPLVVYAPGADGVWQRTAIDIAGSGSVAMTARGAYVASARYDGSSTTSFAMHVYDPATREIGGASAWSTATTILTDPESGSPDWNLSFFSPGDAFFAVTYLTAIDASATTQTVEVIAFDWSADYHVTNADGSFRASQTTDVSLELPSLLTAATGAQLGNCGLSARYDGERWWQQTLPVAATAPGQVAFGYGGDLLLVANEQAEVSAARFDPPSGTWQPTGISAPATSGEGPPPAMIGGRTAAVGRTIYLQDRSGAWQRVGDLPAQAAEASVRLCGEGVVAFEEGTGTDASARLARLDGDALAAPAPGEQSSLDGQRFTVDGAPARGTQLVGSGMFVTYPAVDSFANARTLVLHRLAGPALDEPLSAFAATRVTVDDGYRHVATSFWYDPRGATFDATGRVAQYGAAWSFAGAGATPEDAQYGATEVRFYNGLAPAERGTFYPTRDARENYSRLSGTQIYTRTFASTDAGLAPVSFAMSGTSVMPGPQQTAWSRIGERLSITDLGRACSSGATAADVQALDGGAMPADVAAAFTGAGFVLGERVRVVTELAARRWILVDESRGAAYVIERIEAELVAFAGASAVARYEYDRASGLVASVESHAARLDGSVRALVRTMRYGHDVYPAMKEAHYLGALVELTVRDTGTVAKSRLTTWREWGAGGWGPECFYAARTPAATFALEPDPSEWALRAQIVARDAHGQAIERTKRDGLPYSIFYDAAGVNPIASFANGSRTGGEVLAASFQPGEDLSAWTLDGAAIDPSAALAVGDSHSGLCSLRVGAKQTLAATLAGRPRPTDYAISFWVKATADATFTVSAGGASCAIAIGDTGGCWAYRAGSLSVGAGPISMSLTPGAALLLGDVLFAPALGDASLQVYAPGTSNGVAVVRRTGLTSTTLYDDRGQKSVSTAHGRVPLSTNATSGGRRGDGFDPSRPAATVSLRAAGGGVLETFADGDEWRHRWSQTGDAWAAAGGALVHAGGAASTIELRADAVRAPSRSVGVQARVRYLAMPTAPIVLAAGGATATWTPGPSAGDAGAWTLACDGASTVTVAPAASCALPPAYRAALAAKAVGAQLAEALAARGIPVPVGAPITAERGAWRIDDESRAQRYLVAASPAGFDVTRLTLEPGVWLLVVDSGAALLYLDGRQLAGLRGKTDAAVAPSVTATDAVELAFLAAHVDPTLALALRTATSAPLQLQVLEGAATTLQQTLLDELGRTVGTTKGASIAGALPGYRSGFVTGWDPTDGTLTGEIADYYRGQDGRSDDGGYPYRSIALERAPSARVVERGQPGADYAIVPSNAARHTTRVAYGGTGVDLGLTGGAFALVTATDPNGIAAITATDQRGAIVQARRATDASATAWRITSTETTHGDDGATLEVRPPNGWASADDADAWDVTQTTTLLGEIASFASSDRGSSARLYDDAGHIRVQQDARGRTAAAPYVQYWRYDGAGRTIETGVTAATWAEASVRVRDPSWPDEPATWRVRTTYGTDPTDPAQYGRPVRAEVNNADTGTADVVETFAYDLAGHLIAATQQVVGVDAAPYETRYDRDSVGRIRRVRYPDGKTTACYSYDAGDRVVAIGRSFDEPDSYARYAYDANGAMIEEVLAGGIRRARSYLSPGWASVTTDSLTSETTGYSGFFDGTIASSAVDLDWTGAPAAIDEQYGYADPNRLTSTNTASWSYDANGNPLGAGAYTAGTNQLATGYAYDANGCVISTSTLSSITYDPATNLPRTIAAGKATVSFRYGASQRRALKSVGAATLRSVRGTNGESLLERSGDDERCLIYGPRGLVAIESSAGTRAVLLDRLGSVLAITDAAGAAIAGFQYGAWGEVTVTGDATALAARFTGQELDAETGLYNFHLRLYDPSIGRFYAPDPACQYPSPYTYVGDDPLRLVDPSGAFAILQGIFDIVGLAVEAVVDVVTFGAATPEEAALDAVVVEGEVALDSAEDILEGSEIADLLGGDSLEELSKAADDAKEMASGLSADTGEMEEGLALEPTEDTAPTGDDEEAAGEASDAQTEGWIDWGWRQLGEAWQASIEHQNTVNRIDAEAVDWVTGKVGETATATKDAASAVVNVSTEYISDTASAVTKTVKKAGETGVTLIKDAAQATGEAAAKVADATLKRMVIATVCVVSLAGAVVWTYKTIL